MSQEIPVYEMETGHERLISNTQSPLQLFKGPEALIKGRPLTDGVLYFATDTKKIYLDCDFADSLEGQWHDRLAFGGSSGIFYSQKTFQETDTEFNFMFSEIEGVLEYDESTGEFSVRNMPKIDDLILDEANGTFFRVTAVYEDLSLVATSKLVVAGGGGGEGGGGGGGTSAGFYCQLLDRSMGFSENAENMFIRYVAYAPSAIEGYENQVDIEVWDRTNNQKLFVIENIVQSGSRTQTASTDIKSFLMDQVDRGVLEINQLYSNNLGMIFTDGTNRSAIQPITTFAIVSLTLTPETKNLNDFSNDALYGVVPHYNTNLIRNAVINYRVLDQQTGRMYQEGIIENLSNNTPSQVIINYQKGMAVNIESYLKGTISGTSAKIQSQTLVQGLIFLDPANPIPTINASWPQATTYEIYTRDAVVNYRIVYSNASTSTLSGNLVMYKQIGNTWTVYSRTPTEFALGTNLQWIVPFEEEGVYRLQIQVGQGAGQQTLENLRDGEPVTYTVSGSSSVMPIVADGAQFDFTPDRNETASNKTEWSAIWYNPNSRTNSQGQMEIIGDQEIFGVFEGFNWTTNGWMKVPDTNRNKLVLNNGAKFTLPIAPFYGQYNAQNGTYNGAVMTGKTIEFDVKISNIRDRKKHIIDCSCYDTTSSGWQNKDPMVGIVATGDYFILTTSELGVLTGMQTNGVVNDTVNGLVAHYSADERVHICYVIARSDANIDAHFPKNYIYTYVNGVLSGIVARNENDNFRQNPSDGFITQTVFDSNYADIELYNFRFYGKALSAETVLDNYLAGLGDPTIATQRKAANNIIDYYADPEDSTRNYTYIDLAKVKQSASIPYLVLRGGYRCDKKGKSRTQTGDNAEVSLPYFDKKDFRYMEAYFVDPNDFSRCFGIKDPIYNDQGKIINFTSTSADRWKVTIYPQGTSSLEYPVKNLRMKTINKNQKYQLFPNTPPCQLFTFKADYMDSSMSHNTGTANQLNALYDSADITLDPIAALRGTNNKYANYDLLSAIEGRPCVIFHWNVGINPGEEFDQTDLASNYSFIGRYNFDFDKGEPDLFGFFSDAENNYGIVKAASGNGFAPGFEAVIKDDSETYDPDIHYYKFPIYGANNLPATTYGDGIANEWLPSNSASTDDQKNAEFAEWLSVNPLYVYKDGSTPRNSIQCWEMKNNNNNQTSFRQPWDDATDRATGYKTWVAAYESRYPEYSAESASDKRAFSAFLNWVASTNLMTATNADLPAPVVYRDVTYTKDTQEYRLEKFRAEFDSHMKSDFVTFYYIITELEILMDSRAKNMMMVSYNADNETGTGLWYPIFYDMDTALGVNNTGKLVYRYDEVDTKFGIYNTTADYPRLQGADVNGIEGIDTSQTNAEYSVLWTNFRLCFAQGYNSRVATMYRKMRRGNLSLNFLLDTYNNELANAWNETFINQDAWYKFIRPKDEPNYKYDSKGNHVLKNANGSATDPNNWELRDTNYSSLLYAAQGTRSEHRKQWLKRRLLLHDGKYAADGTAFRFKFRVNTLPRDEEHPNDYSYDFTTQVDDSSYIWANFKAKDLTVGQPIGPIYIPEGETKTITIPASAMPTQEQEGGIFFGQNVLSHGNFGRLGVANVATENNTGISNLQFKLREFNVALTPYLQSVHENHIANPWSTFEGQYYPLLETLNLDYMYSKMENASLRSNTYLRTISAQHSHLKTITFPEGGVLTTVKVPETLMGLQIRNQPLLTTVTCDNDSWRDLKTLEIKGCPNFNSKELFIIGKKKEDKVNRIDLQDIEWELDPTNPDECTLSQDGRTIVDFPILEWLITTSGLEANAPWSTTQNRQVYTSYYVGGHVHIKSGKNSDAQHWGLDGVAVQTKYTGCFPNLRITYDDNDDVVSSFTVEYYDANKNSVAAATKQYPMTTVPTLSASDLFGHLSPKDFAKTVSAAHTYELVGFKVSDNDDTDLFIETYGGQEPSVSYESAYASARIAADVYVDVQWTAIAEDAQYDPTKTYYKLQSLHVLNNPDYIWIPTANTAEDQQVEFEEYLAVDDLYTYDSISYSFKDGFSITADRQHKSINFYPIYVAKVRRFRVKFFDSDNRNIAKVISSQVVKYFESATVPSISPTKTVLNPNDVTDTLVFALDHYADDYNSSYNRVTENQFQYPVFSSHGTDIRNHPASEEYFIEENITFVNEMTNETISGIMITLQDTYRQEAITIPLTYRNRPVIGLNSVKRSKDSIQASINALTTELNNATSDEERVEKQRQITVLEKEKADTIDLRRIYFQAPDNATNQIGIIRNGAFMNNSSLEYVELGACYNMNAISITPGSNATIAVNTGTFSKCPNLQIDQLPQEIRIVGPYAFSDCSGLTLNRFPTTIKRYGDGCFRNCVGLTEIDIGNRPEVIYIDAYAFSGCTNLEFIQIDSNFPYLNTVGNYAFQNCAKINFLNDANKSNSSLKTIGRNAFDGCVLLDWATMPTTLQSIGAYAFRGVNDLHCALFPSSLTTIQTHAFHGVCFYKNTMGGFIDYNVANNTTTIYDIKADAFSGAMIKGFSLMLGAGSAYNEESILQTEPWSSAPWGAVTATIERDEFNNITAITPTTTPAAVTAQVL